LNALQEQFLAQFIEWCPNLFSQVVAALRRDHGALRISISSPGFENEVQREPGVVQFIHFAAVTPFAPAGDALADRAITSFRQSPQTSGMVATR
jgi:hypothetical protein